MRKRYQSIFINKEATCGHAGDFRADGIDATQLPFPEMSFHIDHSAVDHSEVTSDNNSLSVLFLTYYRKALPDAFKRNFDIHDKLIICLLEAGNGFNSTSSAYFQKNRVFIPLENKYPIVKALGACPLPMKIKISVANVQIFSDVANLC